MKSKRLRPPAHSAPIHGTCVAIGRRGVLLRGRSGAGKSDLALRLIADGARLVADDQVLLHRVAAKVIASSPKSLRGLIEVRGVDVLRVPCRSMVEILLVAACLPPDTPLERIPDPGERTLAGVVRPLVQVRPLEASAPAKLHRVLSLLGA